MDKKELYECHGHIMMDGTEYAAGRRRHENGPDRAAVTAALTALQAAGVTYFRDGGDPLGVSLLARELAGAWGIEYVTPAFAIHKRGRYGGIVGRACRDLEDYRRRLEEVDREGGDFVKLMTSGIITFRAYGELSCDPVDGEEVFELVRLAHEAGFPVMVHVNGPEAVRAAAEAGAESVEHGYFADEAALQAMAAHGTVWVPTLAAVEAFLRRPEMNAAVAEETVSRQGEMLRRAEEMGVLIAAGSDSGAVGVPHGEGTRREYDLLSRAGISPETVEEGNRTLRKTFRPR